MFTASSARYPARAALVADGARLSFAEIDARTDDVANALSACGVGRGTTIGTLVFDELVMIELLIAGAKLGATLLTLNWRLSAPEIRYILANADPSFVVVAKSFVALARAAEADRNWRHHLWLVWRGTTPSPGVGGSATDGIAHSSLGPGR